MKVGAPQPNYDDVRLDATPALALQNPTALYSQGGFPVGSAIDNDLSSGWAGSVGGGNPTPANIGVFETQANAGYLSGTVLTFRLDQQFGGHSIGKFRLSVTTDDRSTYADGLANGGDVTANWVPLAPLSAVSTGGATMAIERDNAVFVSGTYPSVDTYTVKATTTLTNITGVRVELLEDPRLSDIYGGVGGPGRTAHGNYVLTDFRVAANPLLQTATATGSQGGFPVSNAINNSNAGTGWADDLGGYTPANTAVFETSADLGLDVGTVFTFKLDNLYGANHTLGKFRISATTDDRALFANGLVTGGDVAANWVQLVPELALSANGASMTINPDNSILVGGVNPNTDIYTIIARTWLKGITGFRLEALEDPSLLTNGPGRAGNGNYVLTNFSVDATPMPEPGTLALLGLGAAGMLLRRRRRG